jgi:hypothetical protein
MAEETYGNPIPGEYYSELQPWQEEKCRECETKMLGECHRLEGESCKRHLRSLFIDYRKV